VEEIARAPVATAPGTGPIDTITASCAEGTLALFVLRGHTLSRIVRRTVPGVPFNGPEVWATGVDRLGPVAPDAVRGPVAWRSPLVGIDPDERDDVWAAVLRVGDGGDFVSRGDALLPRGLLGLGVPIAVERRVAGVTMFASVAREGEAPFAARIQVSLGDDHPAEPMELPFVAHGELKAWEASRGVALARVDDLHGAWLEATWRTGGMRSRHRLTARHALVASRGVHVEGHSVFAVGEFERGTHDGGRCMVMGEGMCVTLTGLYALIAGVPGAPLERVPIASEGLPDALASHRGQLLLLYLSHEAFSPRQRVARIDFATRTVTELTLTPPRGLGAIDGPTLVPCDDGVWLAAELAAEGTEAPSGRVTAIPLECLAR
jgi:hypothetical protein